MVIKQAAQPGSGKNQPFDLAGFGLDNTLNRLTTGRASIPCFSAPVSRVDPLSYRLAAGGRGNRAVKRLPADNSSKEKN